MIGCCVQNWRCVSGKVILSGLRRLWDYRSKPLFKINSSSNEPRNKEFRLRRWKTVLIPKIIRNLTSRTQLNLVTLWNRFILVMSLLLLFHIDLLRKFLCSKIYFVWITFKRNCTPLVNFSSMKDCLWLCRFFQNYSFKEYLKI